MEQKQIAASVKAERWNPEKQIFEETDSILAALGFADWRTLPRVISIVGAGGKTSTMYDLAEELAAKGARILITTSTHIAKPEQYRTEVIPKLADLDAASYAGALRNPGGFILAAGKQAENPDHAWKLAMPEDLGEERVMKRLLSQFDVILIEADGAKRLPLKVPSDTEPVLIPQTGLIIACVGLTACGKQFGDSCFRFASHGSWLHKEAQDAIAAEDMTLLLMDERGSRKGVDGRYYRILLNQADTKTEQKLSEKVASMLPGNLQSGCVRTTRKRRVNTMIDTETTDAVMTNTETKQRLTGMTDGMGRVLIKGSGDLASGIALRLHRAGFRILMTDIAVPTTVRRTVAFSPAVYQGHMQVEDVTGVLCDSVKVAEQEIQNGNIAVMVDETARCIHEFHPDVVVDAILAKHNLGTKITDAPFVVGVGPGFTAGEDCHCVVETKRGHYLGRCIWKGSAIPNTGIPGMIGGYGLERLIKAPAAGVFKGAVEIGAVVKKNDVVGYVDQTPVLAQIDGVVRGLLQDGVEVTAGMKSGDVDPRCDAAHCFTVSDKASSIGGGVLEAVLNYRFRPHDHMPVAMVLLAAGDSRRFGGNKLLAEVDGRLMYRHVADEVNTMPEDFFAKKIVVSQYDEILEDLGREGFETVKNNQSALGISHSVHLALEQIPEHYAVCFSVSDQPWLTRETIRGLVTAFRKNTRGMVCASWEGMDGNPVIFAPEYRKELLALSGDVGGRRVLMAHPEDVVRFVAGSSRELADVDEKSQLCYNQND